MPNIKSEKIKSFFSSGNNSKIIYTACALVVLVTLSIFNLSYFYSQQLRALNDKIVLGTKNNTETKLDYWYKMASQHPNYIVAWLEIAKLENGRGNHQAVLNAIKFAEAIEPNLEELAQTKKELGL